MISLVLTATWSVDALTQNLNVLPNRTAQTFEKSLCSAPSLQRLPISDYLPAAEEFPSDRSWQNRKWFLSLDKRCSLECTDALPHSSSMRDSTLEEISTIPSKNRQNMYVELWMKELHFEATACYVSTRDGGGGMNYCSPVAQ